MNPIFARLTVVSMLAGFTLSLTGCGASPGGDELPTEYGKMGTPAEKTSINGTSGLARMVESNGSRVDTWYKLSPRVNRFNTIFWFPDRNQLPEQKVSDFLENWLNAGYGRTLVYVCRDEDQELEFWKSVREQASGRQRQLLNRKLAEKYTERIKLQNQLEKIEGVWCDITPQREARTIRRLSGPIANETRASDVRLLDRTDIGEESVSNGYSEFGEPLLEVDGRPFVVDLRSDFGSGRIIIVKNGSFLLNYGLTSEGNRKLASNLINEIDPQFDVLFLESGPEEITISRRDLPEYPTLWDWAQIWPYGFVIPHLLVLGVVLTFALLPTFGRLKELTKESDTDFGKHLTALATLWKKTGKTNIALQKLRAYQSNQKKKSRGLGMTDAAVASISEQDSKQKNQSPN